MKLAKQLFTQIITVALCAMSLTACSSSDPDDPTPTPPDGGTYRRSVLIYLAAQNSLGYAGAARLDSVEIAQGASQLSNTSDNVFLFIDDAKKPRLYRIYKYGKRTITDKILTWTYDANSSDPATLNYVISQIASRYPSESYGLVMWSHGNGWLPSTNKTNTLNPTSMRSIGIDVGSDGDMAADKDIFGRTGTQMDISDMAQAIEQSGVHLDYIFFDACLMQNIEVAYELKDVTDYVIGSTITTSAYGGYYTNLIPKALFAYPATDDNIALIATQYYYDSAENQSLKKYYGDMGSVISAVKTSALKELAQTSAQYIQKAFANKTTPSLKEVQAYSSSSIFNSPNYYDMGSAMYHFLSEADYQAWLAVAKKAVLVSRASSQFILTFYNNQAVTTDLTDPDHILGISMFVPQTLFNSYPYSPYNTYFKSTSWYSDAGWSQTGW